MFREVPLLKVGVYMMALALLPAMMSGKTAIQNHATTMRNTAVRTSRIIPEAKLALQARHYKPLQG